MPASRSTTPVSGWATGCGIWTTPSNVAGRSPVPATVRRNLNPIDLTAPEVRVLGCLLEKQRTTPDTYPLTLNALRAACNQSTNRDPVVAYDEATVREAMTRLSRRRWARLASGAGRSPKFRHLLDEALMREPTELAVLCVLMLRGPQTPGELKQRSDRLHPFLDVGAVHETVRRLIDRDLVVELARRPGQKEERYAHRLSDENADEPVVAAPVAPAVPPLPASGRPMPPAPQLQRVELPLEERVARLEEEIVQLRAELRALRGR